MWRASSVYRHIPGFRRLKRAWRSRGFGIHSPFAFRFVTCVLRERGEYYAYAELRRIAHSGARFADLSLLFRLVCFFEPSVFGVYGDFGVQPRKTVALADSRVRIIDMNSAPGPHVVPSDANFTLSQARIKTCENASGTWLNRGTEASQAELKAGADASREKFMDMNGVAGSGDVIPDLLYVGTGGEYSDAAMLATAFRVLHEEGVVVCRGLSFDTLAGLKSCLENGMTFTNGTVTILVSRHDLPRQDFEVNF